MWLAVSNCLGLKVPLCVTLEKLPQCALVKNLQNYWYILKLFKSVDVCLKQISIPFSGILRGSLNYPEVLGSGVPLLATSFSCQVG